jgi:cold shock CspA family protein
MAVPLERSGTVAEFDDAAGLGTVRGDDGVVVGFHCTSIADGSRTIPVGTSVRYEIVPGRLGRWEATGVSPRS